MFTSSVYFGDRNFTLAWQMTFCQTCCPMRWLQIPFLTTALDPLDPMDPMDPMDPTCLSLSILLASQRGAVLEPFPRDRGCEKGGWGQKETSALASNRHLFDVKERKKLKWFKWFKWLRMMFGGSPQQIQIVHLLALLVKCQRRFDPCPICFRKQAKYSFTVPRTVSNRHRCCFQASQTCTGKSFERFYLHLVTTNRHFFASCRTCAPNIFILKRHLWLQPYPITPQHPTGPSRTFHGKPLDKHCALVTS